MAQIDRSPSILNRMDPEWTCERQLFIEWLVWSESDVRASKLWMQGGLADVGQLEMDMKP